MPTRYLVPFVVRTSGSDQSSDICPILSITYTLFDLHHPTSNFPIEEIDVCALGLQASLSKFRNRTPDESLIVTNGIETIRQVLHPAALRASLALDDIFFRFIDITRFTSFPTPLINNECCASKEITTIRSTVVDKIKEGLLEGVEHCVDIVRNGLRYTTYTCERVIDSSLIVRARGLPWQASDHDVAQFFVGLNIAPSGVALCLSAEGRRNGEALVRFEDARQRELALKRHRHFLNNRYIEVYRATGEDFLQITAGSSSEAVRFVSRGGAMIIRMRGLPYDCTDAQIRDFFAEGENGCTVMEGGILFVNKSDGRPTGDAFVMFGDQESGQKALEKHRQSIGSRYIELFRSTQAEVQQVVNKSLESGMMQNQGGRKDCLRLRGLPYEAHVDDIVEFLGESSQHIVYQGVHMVYNAQGHPSGEAFIQMDTDISAASAAATAHNKYMQIGKKQRYIEVFQCGPEDMNLIVATAPLPPPPPPPPPPVIFPPRPIYPQAISGIVPTVMSQLAPLYWPYPQPPMPSNIYPLPSQPGLVLITGLAPTITPQDVLSYFNSNPEVKITPESVQILRWGNAPCGGEALVSFHPRPDIDGTVGERMIVPAKMPFSYPLIHT